MTVDPGHRKMEKIAGGIKWYMMRSKDYIASISSKLRNENKQLV